MPEKQIKLAIASDHAGFPLKKTLNQFLRESLNLNFGELKLTEVLDYGTTSEDKSVHYPDFAQKVAQELISKKINRGILICGTGIGISISANRFKGIRAALCQSTFETKLSREHNNSNILCLGAWILSEKLAKEIIKTWLSTKFQEERHQKRIDLIDRC